MSCRGQSAPAQDCRHHQGQRAHLHRWCYRISDIYRHGMFVVKRRFSCFTHSPSLCVCLLSGKCVGGQAALEMGLVNRAVEQNHTGDAAYREALSLAREILPQVRIHSHFFILQLLRYRCILPLPPPPPPALLPLFTCSNPSILPLVNLSSFCHPLFLVLSSPLALSLPLHSSLQASVVPYFFHSSSDACSRAWLGPQSSGEMDRK